MSSPVSPSPITASILSTLAPELIQVIEELGYKTLTPIQEQSLPVLLKGGDVIGQSKTGSGKTAAFTLPILQKLSLEKINLQKLVRTHALILCPTRELCNQVAREIRKLGRRHMGLQILTLSGGQPMTPQIRALEMGVHIIVGTPGRVIDHISKGTLDLSNVSTLVLDEADRMLDMGFEEDMAYIFEQLPEDRQTVLFSATFPKGIENMSRKYQKDAVRVTIEDTGVEPSIQQVYCEVALSAEDGSYLFTDKLKTILWTLANYEPESSIIFCNFKASVAELARALQENGVSAAGLHGDLEQAERDSVMAKFRNQSTRILVATDVAARGIDVADLDLVMNFEIPKQNEIYVHRIGRTGRAGKTGIAVTLALPKEMNKIESIQKMTGVEIEKLETENLGEMSFDDLRKDLHQENRMETLFISGGRKNKVRPGDILGALTGEAGGLNADQIGKIEIHDFFAYVAVATQVAKVAMYRLRDGKIKGRRFRIEMAN
jgi:ATP-independent RNA helicase DbpA